MNNFFSKAVVAHRTPEKMDHYEMI